MPRKTFSQEMQELKDEILMLSSMVEQAVMDSAAALRDNDLERACQILLQDVHINRRRFEIEFSVMVLMATQQPIAHDLRLLAASLHICTELERIGDYAKGIANIHLRSEGLMRPDISKDIHSMAEQGTGMLHRTMTAFAEEDIRAARSIISEDDRIDECYIRLYDKALDNIMGAPGSMGHANHVIWAAHNLERLGDRVSNICEWIIYIATGEQPGGNSLPK